MNPTFRFKKSALAPLALVAALGGCASSPMEHNDAQDPVDLEVAGAELGIAIGGCDTSGWAPLTSTLALTLGADTLVLSAPSGKITANGLICKGVIATVSTQLTTANVSKITIAGTTGDDKVILDLLPGTFGTKIFSATGGITVDFSNAAADSDSFMIRGGAANDVFKFSDKVPGEIYGELTGDKNADVKITTDTAANLTLTVSMGAGNDTVTGAPLVADINKFGGVALVIVPPLTTKLVAHGGAGNDLFTGGSADDEFHGGAGADTFKMAATDDGSDIYEGDADVDTVDYSNRTMPVTVDIGPSKVSVTGTVDLTTLDYAMGGALDTLALALTDYLTAVPVTFANPTSPSDLVAQINTAAGATIAALSGQNFLKLTTTSALAVATFEVGAGSADTALGLTVAVTSSIDDADDGLPGENDDVRATVENITGGTGNDILIGNSVKNVIKGGAGDDKIEGGPNTVCTDATTTGDVLSGEAGDDIVYMPAVNCFATINGGANTDTVDYSARGLAVVISNTGGTAGDGNAAAMEQGQIGVDVEKMIGGFGADTITGGAGNDTLVGGPGADTLSGAAGDDVLIGGDGSDILNGGANGTDGDTVAYSDTDYIGAEVLVGVTVTLCFDTAALTGDKSGGNMTCGAANDGVRVEAVPNTDPPVVFETDQVLNVEHVIGGDGADTFSLSAAEVTAMAMPLATKIGVTFEGGAGIDTLTGGPGNDTLWGDDDADTLDGADGDDTLDGGDGDDVLIGGAGDGDICTAEVMDLVAAVDCELGQ